MKLSQGVDSSVIPLNVEKTRRIQRSTRKCYSAIQSDVIQPFLNSVRPLGGVLCVMRDKCPGIAGPFPHIRDVFGNLDVARQHAIVRIAAENCLDFVLTEPLELPMN